MSFLASLRREISALLVDQRFGADPDALRQRLERDLWTLAILWARPPVGSSEQIAQWLREHRLLAEVEPLRDQLLASSPPSDRPAAP